MLFPLVFTILFEGKKIKHFPHSTSNAISVHVFNFGCPKVGGYVCGHFALDKKVVTA
jgi:hypothetical protein